MAEADLSLAQPTLAEQFDDIPQQREAAGLGMWTFLVTEVLLFGVLFTGYTVYRVANPHAFGVASEHLYLSIGTVNTAILLISSFTMALAVHFGHHQNRRLTVRFLLITAGLGVLFLAFKAVEYTLDYRDALVPGVRFDPARAGDADVGKVQMFFVFYFIMTGIHAIHVLAGVGAISTMATIVHRTRRLPDRAIAVELTGLYWHLVDLIWIFLFPIMYLVR